MILEARNAENRDSERFALLADPCDFRVHFRGAFSGQMDALKQERDQLQSIANRYAMAKTWISDFEQYVHAGGIVNVENGVVIRALTDEIVVFDDHMEIHFKCGVIQSREYVK